MSNNNVIPWNFVARSLDVGINVERNVTQSHTIEYVVICVYFFLQLKIASKLET